MKSNLLYIILLIFFHEGVYAQVLDSSFGTNGVVLMPYDINVRDGNSEIISIAQQSDGKLIAGGNSFDYVSSFVIVRYYETGIVDSSFYINGRVSKDFDSCNWNDLKKILIQPDDKIIAVGTVSDLYATNRYNQLGVARFTADGYPDSTFNGNGELKIDIQTSAGHGAKCNNAALQNDGKIVLCGVVESGSVFVIRLNSDGSFDSTFNDSGKIIVQNSAFTNLLDVTELTHVLVTPNDKILTSGYIFRQTSPKETILLQFNKDGTPDSTFGIDGKMQSGFGNYVGSINGIDLQPDGKIIVAGRGSYWGNSTFAPYFARCHAYGAIDSSFYYNGKNNTTIQNLWTELGAMTIDTSGKIYAAGWTTDFDQVNSVILMRYTNDGQIDNVYTSKGILTDIGTLRIRSMLIQPDGKLIAAGFLFVNSSVSNFILLRYLQSPLHINKSVVTQKAIDIYPNPATDKLYIAVRNLTSNKSLQYTIINTLGKIVQKGRLSQDIENKPIDISCLNAGTYMFCLEISGDITVSRFIKIDN
ncbi:T9SS type A sorting domain-containing protein [Algoriphagus algorifonticola]|uniref:T9SS type A sorting domain-containing protein n=1 Tax=Algoriphagus algorifonticola TaxID=2593007 RepID=UPI0011A7F2F1|nr:T9SS type A sorting domain-containing protein [Algoriphagus algorifonticola]